MEIQPIDITTNPKILQLIDSSINCSSLASKEKASRQRQDTEDSKDELDAFKKSKTITASKNSVSGKMQIVEGSSTDLENEQK